MDKPHSPKLCSWCEEPLLPGERLAPDGLRAHWECGMRMVAGGANHLLKQCSCCGGTLPPDPSKLSRRKAAAVAAAIFMAMNP